MTVAGFEGTLCDLLVRARERGTWLVLPVEPRGSDHAMRFSFEEILERSRSRARSLQALGAEPGRSCVLVFDNDVEFVISFFSAQWAGLVAVPWHPPNFSMRERAYAARLTATALHCSAQFVLSTRAFVTRIESGYAAEAPLMAVEDLDRVAGDANLADPQRAPHDVAVLQYTSGSTGAPKAVELSHAAIAANLRAIGQAVGAGPRDVLMCWLPMFHDMGLFGSLIFSLYWQIPIVLMTPRSFILRPESWLWAIARFSATLCPAPNFAFQLCISKIRAASIEGLDLRSWRVAFNGSESVQHATVSAFVERFGPYGFARSAMYPVYGLAENVVAACFPPCGRPAVFDRIDRVTLARDGLARPAEDGDERVLLVACVGTPLAGQRLRIMRDGVPAPERSVGEIELNGPSRLLGYHRAEDATARAIAPDGWLRSGDLGYLAAGQLYVIGRLKNVIKRGGESFHAEEIEADIADLPGVAPGYVAVCGCPSEVTGTEEVVVLVEVRARDRSNDGELKRKIAQRCHDRHGVTPQRVLLLRQGALPRTTSGKVRHASCKEMLASGQFDQHDLAGDTGPRRGALQAKDPPVGADGGARHAGGRHPA